MASTDGLNTIPPYHPGYAGTEATTGTDETAGRADAEPRHSDPGDPCTHPWCVAVAEANATATPEERESAQRFGVSVHVLRQIRDAARAPLLAELAEARATAATKTEVAKGNLRHVAWLTAEYERHEAELASVRAELAAYQRPGVPTYDQLLADHAKLLDERADWTREIRESGAELAEMTRQRDRRLAQRDQARKARDMYLSQREDLREQFEASRAEARRLRDALDEARAKAVDGGEWQWGVRYESTDGAHESWDDWTQRRTRDYVAQYNNINSRLSKATLIRQWRGPVELVTDDGSTP